MNNFNEKIGPKLGEKNNLILNNDLNLDSMKIKLILIK